MTSKPDGITLKISGGEYLPTSIESETPLRQRRLPIGGYIITATKPGYVSQVFRATIANGGEETLALELTSERSVQLRREYDENMSSWRSRSRWTLLGALLTGAYGYVEAQAVAASNQAQAALRDQALAATAEPQYQALLAEIRAEKAVGETHASGSQGAYGVTLLISGLWLSIYLDEPQAPAAEAGLGFQTPAIVHDGRNPRLLLSWRW